LSILSRKVLLNAVASGTSNPQLGGELNWYLRIIIYLRTMLVTFFFISEESFVEIQRDIISFVSVFFVSASVIPFILRHLSSQL
jgi:hypothetical protein